MTKPINMTLEQKVQTELKAAMLSKNEASLRALRAIKSAILLHKTSGTGESMTGEDEIKMLQKLVKQRKESADIYRAQSRNDLAKAEEEEIAVIEKFLPAQMSEARIAEEVRRIITELGVTDPAQMGKVMSVAAKQLAGKADNKIIASLVKQILSGA